MERNENGTPVTPRGNDGGLGTLENFFTPERDGCRGATDRTDTDDNRPNGGMGCPGMKDACLADLPLAYAYVPWQKWRGLYAPADALGRGTLFEELDKPLGVYGNE